MDETTLFTLAVLAALLFVLVMCTLSTLAARVKGERLRHDLVRESRRRRADYLASLSDTSAQSNSDVEVVSA